MLRAARRSIALVVSGLLIATIFVAVPAITTTETAAAVSGSDFDAGNIISDAVFYNPTTMNAPQVQAFLNSQVSSCASGFTCLKNYVTTANSQIARSGRCDAMAGGSKSAARIIADVAVACGINPEAILTLLQKEQGLVTDSSPSDRQYRSATGYGCPDTADCDATYYGFANQVYNAALQFKTYRASPGGRNYVAGRDNTILYNPNPGCGSSQVYIQNQATAGLYLYTPYQPNAAALANLRGTGDSCSAYGNRNFWRQFNDWFGSTYLGNNFLRTAASPTIYLAVGTTKHPINDGVLFNSLAPLGDVGIVPQSYLDQLATGAPLGRMMRDPSGVISLVDTSGKHRFTTCEQVADFGYDCGSVVTITAAQSALLRTVGDLTDVVRAAGSLYWINGGSKTEAVDSAALKAAGHTASVTALTADAVAHLRFAAPIMRDGLMIRRAGTTSYGLYSGSSLNPVSASLYSTSTLDTALPQISLQPGSFDQLPRRGAMTGLVKDSAGRDYLLTPTGRVRTASGVGLGLSSTTLPSSILTKLTVGSGAVNYTSALKTSASDNVWAVRGTTKRLLLNNADLQSYQKELASGGVIAVASPILDSLSTGPNWLRSGTTVQSSNGALTYFINGGVRMGVPSLGILESVGKASPRVVADSVISSFPDGGTLSSAVTCGTTRYLAIQGTLYPVNATAITRYGLSKFTKLGDATCKSLTLSKSQPSRFLRTSGGDLYVVFDGTKRKITSYSVYTALGGTSTNFISASAYTLGTLRTGTPAVSSDLAIKPVFLKPSGSDAVYAFRDGKKQQMKNPAQLSAAAASFHNKTVYTVPAAVLTELPEYPSSGTAVQAPGSPEIYVISGYSKRIYVGSLDTLAALGIPSVSGISAPAMATFSRTSTALKPTLLCGSARMIGLGGKLYAVTGSNVNAYAASYLPVSAETCAGMPQASRSLPRFLQSPSGDLYVMDKGTKRHLLSMEAFTSRGGSASNLISASNHSLSLFKSGADIR